MREEAISLINKFLKWAENDMATNPALKEVAVTKFMHKSQQKNN